MKKSILAFLFLILISLSMVYAYDSYTYDMWGLPVAAPHPYNVSGVVSGASLGLDNNFNNPQSLFVRGSSIFICDTGNNRIIEMSYNKDKSMDIIRIIDSYVKNGETISLSSPNDIFVSEDGYMYICDTGNAKVVKIDNNLNWLLDFTEPNDVTYDKSLTFTPMKAVADVKGRLFVQARNVNKGLIKYENDGTFTNFYGASEVIYSFIDYVWKTLSTRAQRAQLEAFVPTEYSNICIDDEGFIYAVTQTFEEWALINLTAKPIRRLNANGKNILIQNGINPVIGDLVWTNSGVYSGGYDGPSKFADITVMKNDMYAAIDKTRGRIFGYDNQGNLLYAFGGRGNVNGYFKTPVAIVNIGTDLFVLDSVDALITVFTPTQYGQLIYDALDDYSNGFYDDSAKKWEEVLKLNGNYELAYVGKGKSALREEKYKEAMKYFKFSFERKNYSKAFILYRKEWFEKNIGIIVIVLLIIVLVPLIINKIKKIRRKVEQSWV